MLDIRHLRYFIAVATERNFTRAAESLNMAQPPLSRQIHLIEEELGLVLLDRGKRPLELTPAGRLFYDQALQVVQRMNQLGDTMETYRNASRPILAIGFVPSTIYGRLPDIVRVFRADAPRVELELTEMTSVEQTAALKDGRIDIGFGRLSIEDEAIEQIILRQEPLVLALPLGHPLASAEQAVSLSTIAGEALIVYPRRPRPSFADQVLSMLREAGIEPRRIREVMEVQTAVGLVAAHAGICLVPASVRQLSRPDVVYSELVERATSPITMNFRRSDRSRAVLMMARVIEKVYADWHWTIPSLLGDLARAQLPSR